MDETHYQVYVKQLRIQVDRALAAISRLGQKMDVFARLIAAQVGLGSPGVRESEARVERDGSIEGVDRLFDVLRTVIPLQVTAAARIQGERFRHLRQAGSGAEARFRWRTAQLEHLHGLLHQFLGK